MPSEIKPPMPTPTAYLSEAVSGQATKASGRSGVLYYPGSGTDSGPFHLFAENANVETVIYADYSITQDEARKFLNSFSLRGWKLDEEVSSASNRLHSTPTLGRSFGPRPQRAAGNLARRVPSAFARS